MMMNMSDRYPTVPSHWGERPPLIFTALPSRWGKRRGEEYARLVRAYESCDIDALHTILIAMARLFSDTPRCSETVREAGWLIVRLWNTSRASKDDRVMEKTVICPGCHEFRYGAILAEITRTQHADITGRSGAAVLVHPRGCEHNEFSLVCGSCDFRWSDGMPVATFDAPRHDDGMPPLTVAPSSDEYGPN